MPNDLSYIKFNKSFSHECIGVCLTQSEGNGGYSNLAVTQRDKNGFTLFARPQERTMPIYWIAFGY